jgi:two-component system CheB/CheR fusion protein
MERYAPAYMIVDESHEVLHFSGRTGRFLDPPTGIASLNVLNLVHRDLRMDREHPPTGLAGARWGQWTWSSPQWTSFTGQDADAAQGRGWLEQIPPEDRDRVTDAWAAAQRSGFLDVKHRLWSADAKSYRAVHSRATQARLPNGEDIEWYGTSTDVDEMLRMQRHQQVLLAEFQHRVRNMLAVVGSIVDRSAPSAVSVEDYARNLESRIRALARTQNVLTRSPDVSVRLREIVNAELAAKGANTGQVSLGGPDVALTGEAAETLTLGLHELTTNAFKYGALSTPNGRLAVSWTLGNGADPTLKILWRETGVKPNGSSAKRGFGSELIERMVPYQLGGAASLAHTEDGVVCETEFPLPRPLSSGSPFPEGST